MWWLILIALGMGISYFISHRLLFSKTIENNNLEEDKNELSKISYNIIKTIDEQRMIKNYPVGVKVICRSNEDEPYEIGIIKDYIAITQANNLVPLIEFENGEKICLSIIRPYSKTLCKILDKLTPKEQWNVLSEFNTLD